MAVTVTYDLKLIAREALSLGLDHVDDETNTHDIGTVSGTLSSTGTPVVSKAWSDAVALGAGAATLDLTALGQGNFSTAVTFAGLKIQAYKITARSTNTEVVRIKVGASNPYYLFGDANGEVTLFAGDTIAWKGSESLPDVANGSADEIDISSTDLDAIVDILLVAG